MMRYIMLIGFTLLMALGQVLFKRVAEAGAGQSLFSMIATVQMVAALAVYAAATLLWMHILRTTPLSIAYPFASFAIVIVSLCGIFIFGEQVTLRMVIGIILIVSGVIITNI